MKELRNSSEALYDRYADAVTALVMEQYASAMAESLEAEERAPVEISAELDGRCRKCIKTGCTKALCLHVGRKLLRGTSVAVIVFLLLCGVFAVLFSTVEAIRVPIVNFFIEIQEEKPENSGSSPEADAAASGRNYLEGLTPADYELAEFSDRDDMLHILYRNPAGETICFELYPSADASEPDDSGTEAEALTIGGCDAALIAKDGVQRIVWSRDGEESICRLETSAISREDLLALAEAIENKRGGTPPTESDSELAEPISQENDAPVYDYDISIPERVLNPFPRPQPTNPVPPPSYGTLPIEINTDVDNIIYYGINASLFETNDEPLVWSSVDGEQTGNDPISWSVLP